MDVGKTNRLHCTERKYDSNCRTSQLHNSTMNISNGNMFGNKPNVHYPQREPNILYRDLIQNRNDKQKETHRLTYDDRLQNLPNYIVKANNYDLTINNRTEQKLPQSRHYPSIWQGNIYEQCNTNSEETNNENMINYSLKNNGFYIDNNYNNFMPEESNTTLLSKSKLTSLGPDFTDSLFINSTETFENDNKTIEEDCNSEFTFENNVYLPECSDIIQNISTFCESTKLNANLETLINTSEMDTFISESNKNSKNVATKENKNSLTKLESILFNGCSSKVDSSKIYYVTIQNKFLENVYDLQKLLPNIIECDLRHNCLKSLKGIPLNTTNCICAHNKLTSEKCHLTDLSHLENLDISYNKVGPDLSLLSSCLHLREVNLSHNCITKLGGLRDSWIPLKSLNISSNEISGTVDFKDIFNAFKANTFNQKINRSKKMLNLKGWLTIETLDLSNNKIVSIQNISLLPNLKHLNLNGNPIKFIQDNNLCNHDLQTLTIIDTSYKLRSVQSNNKHGIPFNKLVVLRIDGFYELSEWRSLPLTLQTLEIRDTFKKCLPKWHIFPKTLKILKLENIKDLTHLPIELKNYIPFLEELILPNNNLESCHNLLSSIPVESLTKIDLRGNPIAIKYEIENDSDTEKQYNMMPYTNNGNSNVKQNLYTLIHQCCPNIKITLLRSKE